MLQRRGLWWGLGLMAVGVLGILAGAGLPQGRVAPGPRPQGFGRGGMMGFGAQGSGPGGSGGMMEGRTGTSLGTWSAQQIAAAVRGSERGVTVDRATNTITYHGHQDVVVPLAAPAALHLPGMQWEIDGLINPTVVVPRGARITVKLVNADQGYHHGFEVTTARPPFTAMAMMQGRVAFSGGFIMPIPPESGAGAFHAQSIFTAAAPGTYSYICPVPGHAAQGMAGTLVVS